MNRLWLNKTWFENESENGLEFTSSGSSNTETIKVNGTLENKCRWTEYCLVFPEKWITDNALVTEVTMEDHPYEDQS